MDLSKDTRETPMRASDRNPKAIDLWLKRCLSDRYGSVLQEPLPKELLALLESDAPQ
jgi:hypothetical protein